MTNKIHLSKPPIWGWETGNCNSCKGYIINNSVKILAYFPFTGTAIAILSTAATIYAYRELKGQCLRNVGSFIRTGIEFTGLAFLTLPLVDLIVTIHRGCTKKPKVDIELVRNSEVQAEIQAEPQNLNLDAEESIEQKERKTLSQLQEKIHEISTICANSELIINNPEFLIEPFKKNDLNLLFRRSVTDEGFIELFYFLMTNKDILKIDIRSHGEYSGDALEIATLFENERAISVLNRAYQE